MEYLDHALEQDLHKTLHKAKVWSRKKGKHKKDTIVKLNKGDDPWASQRDNYGKMKFIGVGFRYVHRGQFKHKRAERVYLEEEHCIGVPDLTPEQWDYYCDEMHLTDHSWCEWEDYLICKPPEGCSVEVKDYNTCAYCGNKHQHCNCFE